MAIPSYLQDLISQYVGQFGGQPGGEAYQQTTLASQADIAGRIAAAGAAPQTELSQVPQIGSRLMDLYQSTIPGAIQQTQLATSRQAAESGSGLQRGTPGVQQQAIDDIMARYGMQIAQNVAPGIQSDVAAQQTTQAQNLSNLMTGRGQDLSAYLTQLAQGASVRAPQTTGGGQVTQGQIWPTDWDGTPAQPKTPGTPMTAPGGGAYNPGYGNMGGGTFGGQTADLSFMPSTGGYGGIGEEATSGLGGTNLWGGVDWNQAFPGGVPSPATPTTTASGYGAGEEAVGDMKYWGLGAGYGGPRPQVEISEEQYKKAMQGGGGTDYWTTGG